MDDDKRLTVKSTLFKVRNRRGLTFAVMIRITAMYDALIVL